MKRRITFALFCTILSLGIASLAGATKLTATHYEVKLKSASFGDMGVRKMWVAGDKMLWEGKSDRLPLRLVKNDKGAFIIHPWHKIAGQYPKGSNRANPMVLLPGPIGPVKVFLKSMNAAKQGSTKLKSEMCDVYSYTETATNRKCKLWVGVKSGKPVQLLLQGKKHQQDTITATYTKFVVAETVSSSIFDLPSGYAVRPMPRERLASKPTPKPSSKKGI